MTAATTNAEPAERFEPGPSDRVGIVAGGGRLPVAVARSLERLGQRPFVVMIAGEGVLADEFRSFEHMTIPLESAGDLPKLMRAHGVTHLVLAGSIGRRPHWSRIKPGIGFLRLLRKVIPALGRGDDALLKAIIGYLEDGGLRVVGAHQAAPELLAPRGQLTRAGPRASDAADLRAAFAAALAIGGLDIGQAAVAIGGRAVALEGIEGTDGLLERTKTLREHGRLAGKARGVLVKCAKPQQDRRADLPSIGLSTVEAAHAAGLAGIGVEAEGAIVLDMEATLARADELGLFVVGLSAQGEP